MNRSVLLVLAALAFGAAPPAQREDAHALFAAERAGVGGAAWSAIAAIRTTGTQTSGGVPSRFVSVLDHRTGYFRTSTESGPLHDVSGFDGTSWDARNGIVTQADLPSVVADAVTNAYMARDGWWNPRDAASMRLLPPQPIAGSQADVVEVIPHGGSPVDAWLDCRSHLLVRTVQHTDEGDLTTDYAQYRGSAGVRIPFHTVIVDATKARTVVDIATAAFPRSLPPADLQRPAPEARGTFSAPPPATVPFQFGSVDTGHIIVDAQFDGKPVKVIFDSGGANVLTPGAAKRIGLVTGGGTDISGVGTSSQAAAFAKVSAIDLGASRLREQSAIVVPLPYTVLHVRSGIVTEGLLGFETLASFRVTVDYAARTLSLTPFDAPPPPGTTVHFVSEGNHAYIPVTIDGATGLFGLDTGDSGGITVFRRFARAHDIFTGPGRQYVSAGGVGGTVPYALYRGDAMTIAGTTLREPVVSVSDTSAGAFASRSIAGNIGARILDRFRVTFDFHARTVTFVPNDRAGERFSSDRTGMSLTQRDPDAFIVLSVVPDSPAARAGINPGDRIVTIDGKSVAGEHLGGGDLRPLLNDRTANLPLVIRRGTVDVPVTLQPHEVV